MVIWLVLRKLKLKKLVTKNRIHMTPGPASGEVGEWALLELHVLFLEIAIINVLPSFPFTTSETIGDYYEYKGVAKRITI